MQVLKFGGISVGSAERMKALMSIVVNANPKIVVLSAMSGTTNSLEEITNALYEKNNAQAVELINKLEEKYKVEINKLYSKETSLNKGTQLVKYHFDYIRSFTLDMFTVFEEKAILAQGELVSTALFHFYLEEIGVSSVLLPALNFMRIDENEEPDLIYIEENIKNELGKYSGANLFITQGNICRNTFG
ncbi:MAG: aspartate kinase, partial [Bacteroidia bacterium]